MTTTIVKDVAGLVAPVFQIKKEVFDYFVREIKESNNLKKVYRTLEEAMSQLNAKRKDLKERLHLQRRTMKATNETMQWFEMVDGIEKEFNDFKKTYQEKYKHKSKFFFIKRSAFSKKMKERAVQLVKLMEKKITSETLMSKLEAPRVVKMEAPEITHIPSLQQEVQKILSWLGDKGSFMCIRIFGMVGMGKTTILKTINNHPMVSDIFDMVIWLQVGDGNSKNKTGDELKKAVLERLGLEDDFGDNADRCINTELNGKRYLLLLDDVCEDLDFKKMGILTGHDGNKIVFTTRRQHVCSSIVNQHIRVGMLKEEEALCLFKDLLNRDFDSLFTSAMRRIVNVCGYNPLMIKAAAGYFRTLETLGCWNIAYGQLVKWPRRGDDSMKEVYNLYKCFFDSLKEHERKCLLFTSMYPENTVIMKNGLLKSWEVEELLGTHDDADENDRVSDRDVMLKALTRRALVDHDESTNCVSMDPLVRKALIHHVTTSEDMKTMITTGDDFSKPPDMECWEKRKWISFVGTQIEKLPGKPPCSALSTLFVQKNSRLNDIPDDFFDLMGSVIVLDISNSNIKRLPESVENLVSLKVLIARNCKALCELPPSVEKLDNLEFLDIRGTGLRVLPRLVCNMRSLNCLLVSFRTFSTDTNVSEKAIRWCELISKIGGLKELVVEVEEHVHDLLYGAILGVVDPTKMCLLRFCLPGIPNKIKTLINREYNFHNIYFPTETLLQISIQKILHSSEFINQRLIFVGCDVNSRLLDTNVKHYYRFDGRVSNYTLSQVLREETALELVNDKNREILWMNNSEMNQVSTCLIKDCIKMRTLVVHGAKNETFVKLEHLHLINLPCLSSLYQGPIHGFKMLKRLIVFGCPLLKCVCTHGVILQLPEIRHLEISCCSGLVEIFHDCPTTSPILPRLEMLTLVDLRLLKKVSTASLCLSSLEGIKIRMCPLLKVLPFRSDGADKLKSIEVEENWWNALQNGKSVIEKFQPYCNFS